MIKIKLLKKTISLVVTPIGNIDFDINEVANNQLLDEIELDMNATVMTYNMNTNKKTSINVNELTENHILVQNGTLLKIVNMFDDYK
jgi:hypothetical protein